MSTIETTEPSLDELVKKVQDHSSEISSELNALKIKEKRHTQPEPISPRMDGDPAAAPKLQRTNSHDPPTPTSLPSPDGPAVAVPVVSKPQVASSSSASIRRPTQPPPVIAHNSTPHAAQTEKGPIASSQGSESAPSSERERSEEEYTDDTNDAITIDDTYTAGDDGTYTANDDVSVGEPEPDAELLSLEPAVKKIWAIAKYNYDTDDTEELALQQDEVIELLEQNDDGWWKGKNAAGKEGIFPHNFVEITENLPQPTPPTPPTWDDEPPTPTATSVPATTAPTATFQERRKERKSFFKKEKDKDKKKDKHKDKDSRDSKELKESKDDEGHSPTSPQHSPLPSPSTSSMNLLPGIIPAIIAGATSSLPSLRKNSDGNATIGRSSREKSRASTLTQSSTTQEQQSNAIRSSPSMSSLPILPPGSLPPTSLSSSGGGPYRSPSTKDLSVRAPTPTPTEDPAANAAPDATPAPSIPTPDIPASPAPQAADAASPPASPAAAAAPAGLPESFIMKVHVPPSGSSQLKVMSSQTIGELISTLAKKRNYQPKDCSLRLMETAASDPPIDPATTISALGVKELRLSLEGESAAALASAQAPTTLQAPANPPSPSLSRGNVKEGFLMKMDKSKKLIKVWTSLDKNFVNCYKTPQDKNPTEKINLYCSSPKPYMDPKKKHMFDLYTTTNTYTFAAETEAEANGWVSMIGEACQALIMKEIGAKTDAPAPAPVTTVDKAEQKAKEQRARELVLQIRDLPENKVCAECSAPDPDWAAINLGIFFCIDCSGIHRSLGVHISQVRSVLLDFWDTSHILTMETIGNKRANEYWEHTIPPSHHKPTPKSSAEEREDWIRNKYQQKLFADPARSAPGAQQQATPTPQSHPLPQPPQPQPTEEKKLPLPPIRHHPLPPLPPVPPAARPSTPTVQPPAPAPADDKPQNIPGLEFVGYGFFSFNDDPMRPVLRRQARLFKNTFEEEKTSHVSIQNAPPGIRRKGFEFQVPDDYSVDTTSVGGYIPAVTHVFDTKEDYNKFLAAHTLPQLDSYRQTVSMHSDSSAAASTGGSGHKWWVVTEARVEIYELFVNQVDEDGLAPQIQKAAAILVDGDSALLAQFIKKNGTHFVRGATYGGRMLMKTEVDRTALPDKDEVTRLCNLNFKQSFALDPADASASQDALRPVRENFTLDVTGGDNKKRGLDWIDSIWDKPQVLSYELESISAVFSDLALSVKIETAIRDYMDKLKG